MIDVGSYAPAAYMNDAGSYLGVTSPPGGVVGKAEVIVTAGCSILGMAGAAGPRTGELG